MCRLTSSPKGLSLSPLPLSLSHTCTHTSRRGGVRWHQTVKNTVKSWSADRINQTIGVEFFVIIDAKQCTILYGPVLRGYINYNIHKIYKYMM